MKLFIIIFIILFLPAPTTATITIITRNSKTFVYEQESDRKALISCITIKNVLEDLSDHSDKHEVYLPCIDAQCWETLFKYLVLLGKAKSINRLDKERTKNKVFEQMVKLDRKSLFSLIHGINFLNSQNLFDISLSAWIQSELQEYPRRDIYFFDDMVTGMLCKKIQNYVLPFFETDHCKPVILKKMLYENHRWLSRVRHTDDGSMIASQYNNVIEIWNAEGNFLYMLEQEDIISDFCFSHNNSYLATSVSDKTICLWDPITACFIKKLGNNLGWIREIIFSPDDRFIAIALEKGTILAWDISTMHLILNLKHGDSVRTICWNHDGTQIASGSGGTVRIWYRESGSINHSLTGHKSWVRIIRYSPMGDTLTSVSRDCTIRIWDPHHGKLLRIIFSSSPVTRLSYSPSDNDIAVTLARSNNILVWNVLSGKMKHVLKGHKDTINAICYHNNGQVIVSASNDRTVGVWNTMNGEKLHTLNAHKEPVKHVAFDQRGILISVSADSFGIWDFMHSIKQLLKKSSFEQLLLLAFLYQKKNKNKVNLRTVFQNLEKFLTFDEEQLSLLTTIFETSPSIKQLLNIRNLYKEKCSLIGKYIQV